MNLNSREGSAWLDGKKLEGEELKKELERGYGMWVNDTYWLLMPYKMKDPGVILTYAGEEKGGGGAMYDKVKLTFDNVGLTPRDAYWVWVNRDTGMVDRWDFVLKGEAVPPTTYTWTGWKKHGRIMLAGERTNPADGRKLLLPDIAVLESVPDEVFTSPDPDSVTFARSLARRGGIPANRRAAPRVWTRSLQDELDLCDLAARRPAGMSRGRRAASG